MHRKYYRGTHTNAKVGISYKFVDCENPRQFKNSFNEKSGYSYDKVEHTYKSKNYCTKCSSHYCKVVNELDSYKVKTGNLKRKQKQTRVFNQVCHEFE